jgi:methionyl aminopeptidase
MVSMGKRQVEQTSDGWTIRTVDRKPAAHFEHTIAISEEGCQVLTTFEYIEQVYKL